MPMRTIWLLALAALALAQPARAQDEETRRIGRELFANPGASKSKEGLSRGWSIVLVGYRGEDREAAADAALARVRVEGGLPAAYKEARGAVTVVAYGDYDSPGAPEAKADLERVRAMQVEGGTPFSWAVLSPPPVESGPVLSELDLRGVKEAYGKDAVYTLQVGAYGLAPDAKRRPTEKEREEFRASAEQAAAILRREGELAFYYHGVNYSSVTIGVFGPTDVNPQIPGEESELVREVRARYPNNLLNGKGIRQLIPGTDPKKDESWRMQPSALVAIPER